MKILNKVMFRYYSEYTDTIIAVSDRAKPKGNCRCTSTRVIDHLTDTKGPFGPIKACAECKLKVERLREIRNVVCTDCYAKETYYDQLCAKGKHLLKYRLTGTRMWDNHRCFADGYPHMCDYIGVTVQIHGCPVRTKPNDVTYRIRIWQCEATEDQCVPELFKDRDMVIEFSISPTEDPVDLERRYGQFLREYNILEGLKPVDYTFSAPTSKKMYIEQFYLRINSILEMCKNGPPERAPMENNHIESRKKGYSYADK